jgi:hypothetical protein
VYTYDRTAMIRIGALKARKMLPTTVEGKTNAPSVTPTSKGQRSAFVFVLCFLKKSTLDTQKR